MKPAALRAADQAARRLARTQFVTPVVLEAGAGTGKTAALVARVACWLLDGGWERARTALGPAASEARVAARALERVVMITFTEKAAAEMELRIGRALRDLAAGGEVVGLPHAELDPATHQPRARALCDALDRLSVQTIHGFCAALLTRHALAAGLHPGFSVDADGSALRAVCAEVTGDALPEALGERPDPAWLALFEHGQGPKTVLEALQRLVSARVGVDDLRRDPYAPEQLRAYAHELAARARPAAEILTGVLPQKSNRNLAKAAAVRDALAACAASLEAVAGADDFPAELPIDKGTAKRVAEYAAGEFSDTERKTLGEDAPRLTQACDGLADELALALEINVPLARAARAVLAPLLAGVEETLRRRGVLTFQDLLERAGELLREDEQVRAAVRRDIDQLLVDEFQDTDAVQCELVRSIALDGPAEERPGLFLVGDPKQSIYGWRSADLEAYEHMLAEVEQAGGERAQLYVNYRSSQAVLDEVSALVEPLMQFTPGLQPAFEPLVEGRKLKQPPPAVLRAPSEHWCSREYAQPGSPALGKTSAERARQIEARAIAAELAELRAAGVPLSRCAILLRTATQQELYLAALREARVPYVVGKDKGYFQTREIVDAVALTSAILDPTDALALVTFLRSGLGGVPDVALAPLWRAGLPEIAARLDGFDDEALEQALAVLARARAQSDAALLEQGNSGIERVPHWSTCADSALRALHGLRRAFATQPADRAVEQLRAWLQPEVGEAARFPGAHRLANLEHFLGQLVAALAAARGGAQGVLRELRAGLSGEREQSAASPGDAGQDAVRVSSVHAAKGLQFLVVWLADLHHGSGGSKGVPVCQVDRLAGRLEIELFGCASLARAQIAARREAVGAAEAVRLLYVAATRAEDRLVLAGLPGTPGKTGSLADLVAARRDGPPPWEELETQQSADGASELQRDGARWVLIGAREPAGVAEFTPPEGVAAAPHARAALRSARQSARARLTRPLLSPISSSGHAVERAARETQEGQAPLVRDAARAVGVAVHRALERWDPADGDLPTQSEARLRTDLGARLCAADLEPALTRARELLQRFADSELGQRRAHMGDDLLACELPLCLAAEPGDNPVSAWIGAADLVWQEGQALVVADYKTDAGRSDAELLADYGAQLALYARALQRAFERPVRAELWLLAEGRALAVPVD